MYLCLATNILLQVPLFFLLSGFCLALRYGSEAPAGARVRAWRCRFYVSRLLRLGPLYYTANLLGWVGLPPQYSFDAFQIIQVFNAQHGCGSVVCQVVSMTNCWNPSRSAPLPPAFPSWTVSTLAGFYIFFPAILDRSLSSPSLFWLTQTLAD